MLEQAERALAHDESGRLVVEIARLHRRVVAAAIDRPAAARSREALFRQASATRSSDVRVSLSLLDQTLLQMPGNR